MAELRSADALTDSEPLPQQQHRGGQGRAMAYSGGSGVFAPPPARGTG